MAFERSDQKFFLGGRSPSGLTNLLLFLLCIGVIVIILLMLFCPRWGCWRGTKVIGPDGRTYDGGNVIINSACCDGNTPGTPRTPGCPQCPPCDGQTCEEGCRQYANYPDRYKVCMNECNPPQSCEERCKLTATSTTEYESCARQCNPPQTCEEGCRQYSNSPEKYKVCMTACNPPQTCPEMCRQKYPQTYTTVSTGYDTCLRQCYPTCQEYCRGTFSSDKILMQRCFDQCNPTTTNTPPDCRDSDGNNVNTIGEVHLGDQVYRDTCFDNMRVNEWVCRDGKPFESRMTCAEICLNGACVPRPQVQPKCEDSDGNNVNIVGVVRYGNEQHVDTCADSLRVNEWICRDGKPVQSVMTCAGRCLNGACVASATTPTMYK